VGPEPGGLGYLGSHAGDNQSSLTTVTANGKTPNYLGTLGRQMGHAPSVEHYVLGRYIDGTGLVTTVPAIVPAIVPTSLRVNLQFALSIAMNQGEADVGCQLMFGQCPTRAHEAITISMFLTPYSSNYRLPR
jgi:hypothetical protein